MKKEETKVVSLVKTKEQIKELSLSEKLSFITEEVGPIAKTKRPGDTVSFKYRSIDDVQNHLNPLLAEYGVTLQSKVLKHELTMREFTKGKGESEVKKIAYTAVVHMAVIFSDGKETETWEEVSMSEDYADKAMTQAMSMAYKYALLRKFCIVTADLTDPDSREPEHREVEAREHRPTAWLNEKTPQWDEAEEKLRSGEWTVEDVKNKWKVNSRQIPTLESYYKVPAAGAPVVIKESPAANKVAAANPLAKPATKPVLNAEIRAIAFKMDLDCAGDAEKLKKALDGNKDAKAYYNSEKKLRDGSVTLKTVMGIYDLDADVKAHFESIATKS